MSKIVAIVQARMESTRLPGKVLKIIAGKPMLWHVVNRLKKCKLIDEIAIATTTREEDIPIIKLANSIGVKNYAGSEDDVLDRFYRAALIYKAHIIVRTTADCPLIDPKVVDKVIDYFLEGNVDYVSNTIKLTYPDGLDTEAFSFNALEKAWKEAKMLSEREHVTPYIWKNSQIFRVKNLENAEDLSYMRWTVDEEHDLKFVREIYKRLYKEGEVFYMEEILDLLKKHPQLMEINKGTIRNEGYLKSIREDKWILSKWSINRKIILGKNKDVRQEV